MVDRNVMTKPGIARLYSKIRRKYLPDCPPWDMITLKIHVRPIDANTDITAQCDVQVAIHKEQFYYASATLSFRSWLLTQPDFFQQNLIHEMIHISLLIRAAKRDPGRYMRIGFRTYSCSRRSRNGKLFEDEVKRLFAAGAYDWIL
jgi:hypothetical protein